VSETLEDRTVDVEGLTVRVRVERIIDPMNRDGGLRADRATISAPHAGCGELELEAAAGSYFFALGRQDAITGHAAFDDRYIVKTNHEEAMRYWFGADEAASVLTTYDPRALDPYAMAVDPHEVRLTASWHQVDPAEPSPVTGVEEAVLAVAHLARRGARLAAHWRERLAPLGLVEADAIWRADDGYALTVERGRTRVRVDFPWRLSPLRNRGLRTRLRVPWSDAGEAVIWPRAWSWRSLPRLARGRTLELPGPWRAEVHDAQALAALPELSAGLSALAVDWLIAGDGHLAIGWERIVDEPARLAAAIGQLARWSEHVAPRTGPYR
jgi:hypothetical protein